jgi:TfoX/Sxy family transcriptional regulator of competence genes
MPSSQSQVDYILDQLSFLKGVRLKKVFGEYAIYVNEDYLGLLCDNMMFLRNAPGLVDLVGDDGIKAYKGSKNSLHIPEEIVEDKDKLKQIVNKFIKGEYDSDLIDIPGVGKTLTEDFARINMHYIRDFKKGNDIEIFERLSQKNAELLHKTSKNYLYSIRMIIYYANGGRDEAKLKWNVWKDQK